MVMFMLYFLCQSQHNFLAKTDLTLCCSRFTEIRWQSHLYCLPRLAKQIPSYMMVRGWKAYVSYHGQPKTCRICDGRGHIARDCPLHKDNKEQEQPENMDVHDQPSQNEESPEKPSETAPADRVFEKATVEDC